MRKVLMCPRKSIVWFSNVPRTLISTRHTPTTWSGNPRQQARGGRVENGRLLPNVPAGQRKRVARQRYTSPPGTSNVLDVGIGANLESFRRHHDQTAKSYASTRQRTYRGSFVSGLPLPDGMDVSESSGRIFWTNMGEGTLSVDGSIMSSKLDGSDLQVLAPEGSMRTLKQLVIAKC